MRAIKYKIKICNSDLEYAHGIFNFIEEVFVPDLSLIINSDGGCFITYGGRIDAEIIEQEEFELSDLQLLAAKILKQSAEEKEKYFNFLKKEFKLAQNE